MNPLSEAVPTIGVEEELFVTDCEGSLASLSPDGLRALELDVGDAVTTEYKQSQVEIRTGIHTSPEALRDEIAALRFQVDLCLRESSGQRVVAVATLPTADWRAAPPHRDPRYEWIHERKGDALSRLCVSGQHTHIGAFKTDEERVRRIAHYRSLLPLLIGATASSPYFESRDTGWVSWRHHILEELSPQTPAALDYAAHEELLRELSALGEVRSLADIWSDLRLGAGKPTIEFRCSDVSPNVDTSAVVTAFLQAVEWGVRTDRLNLHADIGEKGFRMAELSAQRAARFGITAEIWDRRTKSPQTLRRFGLELVDRVRPFAAELGTSTWLEGFSELLTLPCPAERLREVGQAGIVAAQTWAAEATHQPPRICWPPPTQSASCAAA